jgi:hypothetical protein
VRASTLFVAWRIDARIISPESISVPSRSKRTVSYRTTVDRTGGHCRQNGPIRLERSVLLLGLTAVLAGCGAGDEDAATPPTQTVVVTVSGSETTPANAPGKPTFDIKLTAPATAEAGKPYRFVVTARSKSGNPVGGTAKMRVYEGGVLVNTIGWFTFEGRLTQTYVWPTSQRGKPDVVLEAEVEGPGGTQRASQPVAIT